MSIVTFFVETTDGYLEDAAETQFGAIASTVGTIMVVSMTLLVVLVFINMVFQYRSMDGRTAFWLAVKLALVGLFATNWAQFNTLSTAILNGIDSIAGSLVASVGGPGPGPSGTFAEEFDEIIAEFSEYLNGIGENMNWVAGGFMSVVGTVLLSLLGGLAAFFLIAARLMIALLIGLAPIMIFLTLFEVTKDYFARWLSALIAFAIYPIIIAGVFATIIGVSNSLIGRLADADAIGTIGAVVPFFMMVFMAKGFILATPFLVRAISGNIVMPALSSGLGGAYDLGRGFAGNGQAEARRRIGTASYPELIGLRGRAMAQSMFSRPAPVSETSTAPNPTPPGEGAGAKVQRMQDRANRLRR
ncbi:type IV secretion system protein [Jannaschia sp. LMIT008]|uniref:type IV secretion system protein n=1 Tax=Jannaschia maritima TaxID=3032585 RepID=UPI00281200F3|nr:type IV secretion system protein [Jannaschia sp. LMIT008]